MQRLSIPGDRYVALDLTASTLGGTFRPRKSRLPFETQTRIQHLQKWHLRCVMASMSPDDGATRQKSWNRLTITSEEVPRAKGTRSRSKVEWNILIRIGMDSFSIHADLKYLWVQLFSLPFTSVSSVRDYSASSTMCQTLGTSRAAPKNHSRMLESPVMI